MNTPLSLVELVSLKLMSVDFELIDPIKAEKGGAYDLGCLVKFQEPDDSPDDNLVYGDFSFFVNGISGEDTMFKLNIEMAAALDVVDRKAFDELEENKRVQMCLPEIFPYVREDANRIFRRAGFGQLELPFGITDGNVEQIPNEEYEKHKGKL